METALKDKLDKTEEQVKVGQFLTTSYLVKSVEKCRYFCRPILSFIQFTVKSDLSQIYKAISIKLSVSRPEFSKKGRREVIFLFLFFSPNKFL